MTKTTPKKPIKDWKPEFYPIKANHKSLMQPTRESLILAVDHSIKKWTGLSKIKEFSLKDEANYRIMHSLEIELKITLDASTCALCSRVETRYRMECGRCPLNFAQGKFCGQDIDAYSRAMTATTLTDFSEAAKLMVKSLKKARKIAQNPNFPCSVPRKKFMELSSKEESYLEKLSNKND